MLVVETVVRIRCERANGKAIARDLRLSRKVVRKAISAPEGALGYHCWVHVASDWVFPGRARHTADGELSAVSAVSAADDADPRSAASRGVRGLV